MYLRSVRLINWRSYKDTRFDFPIPKESKNITIVMAPNEYGKTSLFEAIALGLFGREGVELVMRARHRDDEGRISYRKLLQNILHHRTTETGQASCAITLEWEDDDGEPIEIKRIWHFNAKGEHRPGDDDLIIFAGSSHRPVTCPSAVVDKDSWYQDWIKQRFIEPSLARFFLFDGEEVQRLAERDAEDQVRIGIKGLLDLPILEELQSSLEKYATHYDRAAKKFMPAQDHTVESLQRDVDNLEQQILTSKKEEGSLESEIVDLEFDIKELDRRLSGRPEATADKLKELLEEAKSYEDDAKEALQELEKLLAGDVALGIAGSVVRDATIQQLKSEAILEDWEAGKDRIQHNVDRFADNLADKVAKLQPPIVGQQSTEVVDAAKEALEALWHPRPEECADEYCHPSLKGASREAALERLVAIGESAEGGVFHLLSQFRESQGLAERRLREYRELEPIAPELEKLAKQYREAAEGVGKRKARIDSLQRSVSADESKLIEKRRELNRVLRGRKDAEPLVQKAKTARGYARLIGDLLEDAQRLEVESLSHQMTLIWKEMAHHADRLERIEISSDFKIRMLTEDNTDLHQIDRSAGASQIFTQTLIAAITRISGRVFPFVIDTPLARLSRDHRFGVLRVLGQQQGQVILLSTDEEVVEDKYDAVRDKVAAYFELELKHDRGVANTSVRRAA